MATTDTRETNASLSLLYNFANVASSVLDVQALMTHFFNILKTEVDFDLGAYIVDYQKHTEGRLYSKAGVDAARISEFSRSFLSSATEYCPEMTEQSLPPLETSILADVKTLPPSTPSAPSTNEQEGQSLLYIPLLCWGEGSGVISLVSYKGTGRFKDRELIDAMVAQVLRVLERLFTHIFAEEKKLSSILYSMTEGVVFVNKDGAFSAINPSARELLGEFCPHYAKELQSGPVNSCSKGVGEDTCEFTNFIGRIPAPEESGREGAHTEEITNEDGRILSLSASALMTEDDWGHGHVVTVKDITEERLMQRKLILSSKLASLGEMAAGIAHEINNPLQSLLLNIDMLKKNIDGAAMKKVARLEDGVVRIKRIVKDLLIFAREEAPENENVDLNIVIEKGADILRHLLKISNVRITLDLDSRPLIVECSRNLFLQVIINLIQNAKDAIESSNTDAAVSNITISSRLVAGHEVVITVSDDGPGIPEKIIGKIFDPFLTTKPVGKGTGLGLSVSRKIIESMSGAITVASPPGVGTTFTISIPHSGGVIDERRKNRTRKPDYSRLADKTVLVADDELEVLRTVKEAISPHVYRVDTVSDCTMALNEISAFDFDLILLDVRMPGMSGMELYRSIEEQKPYLAGRVIIVSGDIENEETAEFLKLTKCRHLSKPFGVDDLLAAMYETVSKADQQVKH
jgi:signal transduction histidine kinase/ActR/RegA family two-component response regulator/PAS domain-containing protein